MCLLFNMCGMSEIAWKYELQAVAMAHDLKLFKPSTHIKSNRMRQSREFTLWCLFCFHRQVESHVCGQCQLITDTHFSLFSYHFFKAPLIREPPRTPLPDPKQNIAWYGEFWLKYPLNQTLSPMYYGHLFKAKCEFCVIINRVATELFGKGGGGKATQCHSKTLARLARDFTSWYSLLPGPLRPERIVFPSQFKLQ